MAASDEAWSPFGGDTAVCYIQIFGNPVARSIFYLINAQGADTVVTIDTTSTTGISSVKKPGFNVYPNPANDQVTIDLWGLSADAIDIKMYSSDGSLVYTQMAVSGDVRTIATGNLSSGIYLIQVIKSGEVLNIKLVIERQD